MWKAFIASIVQAAHLPLSELAALTDRQLVEIYAHERDKDGAIKLPERDAATPEKAPDSLEKDLRDLTIIAGMLRMPQGKVDEATEKIKAKWAAKEEEASENG